MINLRFLSQSNSNSQYKKQIFEIKELERAITTFTNSEIRVAAKNLQKQALNKKTLDDLLVSSFALTREASRRTLGLRHYDVQLLGGMILNQNKIAEMKTGEGKTLVATLPAVLNALTKKGVHIVTVNEYLANRDQVSLQKLYGFLGLETGLIKEGMSTEERKRNYKCDITYVTNSELTFDFLRDNTVFKSSDITLPQFNYCIVDEVDAVLIDEAQTPIILSDVEQTFSAEKYVASSEIVNYLVLNEHYKIDEKNKNVTLTQTGSKQVEKILDITDLYNQENPWIPFILNALKAKTLFFNNVHYIVQNERILIVDEFTGRIMADRRWGDGLHQAIEAKEQVPIRPRAETQATTTYQNFFLLYPKLSGMTGTGKTAEIEFEKIYNLPVNVVPTFSVPKRKDLPDLIYKDQFSKWNAIAKFCKTIASKGQPVLIGTTTVAKSEMLGQLLNEYDLTYQILNARPENVRRESEIISQAGRQNAVTISTNMAGRGTDIILGGNIKNRIEKDLYNILTLIKGYQRVNNVQIIPFKVIKRFTRGNSYRFLSVVLTLIKDTNFLKLSDIDILKTLQENDQILETTFLYQKLIRLLLNELTIYYKKDQIQQSGIVKNLGGLFVIGTERNDSCRIDNQLRGRCGRQGDPGSSQFFLSLDDNLLRLFGSNKFQSFAQNQITDDLPIQSKFISNSLDSAQNRVEERAFEKRKNLFDYDEILNQQRNIIYFERNLTLTNSLIRTNGFSYGEQIISDFIKLFSNKQLNFKQFSELLKNLFGKQVRLKNLETTLFSNNRISKKELQLYILNEFWLRYQLRVQKLGIYGDGLFTNLERSITLYNINNVWKEHLQSLMLLRESVGWRSYGQKNPLTEYKREAYILFALRKEALVYSTMYDLLRASIV